MMEDRERRTDNVNLGRDGTLPDNFTSQYAFLPSDAHTPSPSNRSHLAAAGRVSSISPVHTPPFHERAESSFASRPDLDSTSFGVALSRYYNEQRQAYEREQSIGHKGQGSATYPGEIPSSLHMSMNCGRSVHTADASLPSHAIDSSSFYQGSASLHRSHFDRNRFNTSPSSDHVPRSESQANNYEIGSASSRNPHTISQYYTPENLLSAVSYKKSTGNPQRGGDISTTDRAQLDAAERMFPYPVSPYMSLGARSDYMYYNSPSFAPFASPFSETPHNSFRYSVDYLTSNGQLNAPPPPPCPPFYNSLLQGANVGEDNRRQTADVSPSPAHDSSFPSDLKSRWNLAATTANLQKQAGIHPFDNQSSASFMNEKSTLESFNGNENSGVESREETESFQGIQFPPNQRQLNSEGSFPEIKSDYDSSQRKDSSVFSNSERISPPSQSSQTSCNEVEDKFKGQHHQDVNFKSFNKMMHPFSKLFPSKQRYLAHVTSHANSQNMQENNAGLNLSNITPCLDSDIVGNKEDLELAARKSSIRNSVNVKNSSCYDFQDEEETDACMFKKCSSQTADVKPAGLGQMSPVRVDKASGPSGPGLQTEETESCSILLASIKEEPEADHYDSSTSEYEVPSPQEDCKKERFTTSFALNFDDSFENENPPRIKLIIKKENCEETQTKTKISKQWKIRKAKRSAVTGLNFPMKRGNRTCPICNKTFSRSDSLTTHMRVHTGDRPYSCNQCPATYKVSSHLRDHIRSKHSDEEPYKCVLCAKAFTYATARRRHEKICGKNLSERVKYQCMNCEKGFVTDKGFEKHQMSCGKKRPLESSAEEFPFKCSTCGKGFVSFPGFDRHQRFLCGKTPQKGQYLCGECGKTFYKRDRYITHTRRHTGEKPFKCEQCEACFFDKMSLKRHVDRHNGNKTFKCSLCEASFYHKRRLSLHVMRVHCGMKPFKCDECDLDFSCGNKLAKHVSRVHRGERRFKCMVCFKCFFDSSTWMNHMHEHAAKAEAGQNPSLGHLYIGKTKRLTCKFCDQQFIMKDLRLHVATFHPEVTTLSEAVTEELAKCDVCAKEFSCPEFMRMHRRRHCSERPFKCGQCPKAFLMKSALVLHQHTHTDQRPHCCPQCGKTFRWSASLSQHMASHHSGADAAEKDSGVSCQVCGKTFKQRLGLKVHMKRHQEVMPFICHQCGKGFIDLCRLKIHMSRHDGPKPFTCEECGAGFFYQYLLNDHAKRKHGDQAKQEYLCEECGKAYCQKHSLDKHRAQHARLQASGEGSHEESVQLNHQDRFLNSLQGTVVGSYQGSLHPSFEGNLQRCHQGSLEGSLQGGVQESYQGIYHGSQLRNLQGNHQGSHGDSHQVSFQERGQGTRQSS